jgi:hypothetical protein
MNENKTFIPQKIGKANKIINNQKTNPIKKRLNLQSNRFNL